MAGYAELSVGRGIAMVDVVVDAGGGNRLGFVDATVDAGVQLWQLLSVELDHSRLWPKKRND